MAKKIFSAILLLNLIFVGSFAMAAENPRADKNFALFYQHQGYDYLLKKDSLDWYEKNSLRVVFFKFVVYDSRTPENTNWDKETPMQFAYNVAEKKVYFIESDGSLDYLNPNGTTAEGSNYAPGAEMVYYLTFGEKFFGTYDDDFYNSLED